MSYTQFTTENRLFFFSSQIVWLIDQKRCTFLGGEVGKPSFIYIQYDVYTVIEQKYALDCECRRFSQSGLVMCVDYRIDTQNCF